MGNFDFVAQEWPQVGDAAARAEAYLRADPRASATYARRAAELFTAWIYSAENLEREAAARQLNYVYNVVPTRHPDGEEVRGWLTHHGFAATEVGELRDVGVEAAVGEDAGMGETAV